MSEKRRILLVATGGTIASQASEHGLRPGLGAEQMLAYIPELREEYELDAIQVCNIDSTNMTPVIWDEIVAAVECKYLYYDGFVICHGTDTMAYTSAALSYMIQNSNKPIVVTGSQKPISEESTDARQNLIDSIRYAGDPASRGVTLVFNGNVIAGTRAKKTYARSYNAFSSVHCGDPCEENLCPQLQRLQQRELPGAGGDTGQEDHPLSSAAGLYRTGPLQLSSEREHRGAEADPRHQAGAGGIPVSEL